MVRNLRLLPDDKLLDLVETLEFIAEKKVLKAALKEWDRRVKSGK